MDDNEFRTAQLAGRLREKPGEVHELVNRVGYALLNMDQKDRELVLALVERLAR